MFHGLPSSFRLDKRRGRVNLTSVIFAIILLFPARIEFFWWVFDTIAVLDITLLVLFGSVVVFGLSSAKISVGDTWIFTILLLPLILGMISLIWSISSVDTAKSIVVYGAAVAAYLVAFALFRDWHPSQICKMLIVLPGIMVMTAIASYMPYSPLSPVMTVPHLGGHSDGFLISYYARFSHPFIGLSNSFATILAIFLPLVLVANRIGVWPWIAKTTAVILVAAVVATGSRGVLLALLIAFGVLALFHVISKQSIPRNLGSSVLWGFPVVILLVAAFFVLSPDAARLLDGRFSLRNVDARFAAFDSAVRVALSEFPFGIGSGVSLGSVVDGSLRSVHNAYLQNILWFGVFFGSVLSLAMMMLPYFIWRIEVLTLQARYVKNAVATSASVLMLINLSQAAWEGSILRIWIYVILAIGVVLIRRCDGVAAWGVCGEPN